MDRVKELEQKMLRASEELRFEAQFLYKREAFEEI